MEKTKLLVISLDALSTEDLDYLFEDEEVRKIFSSGTLVKNVNSIFITNTYPIHTSIITGVNPYKHGIIDNTYLEYGNKEPNWRWYFNLIKTDSIVSQALKAKYKIATIFWPVMAKAPVKYNIPEIIAKDHENQILVVLKNSTKLFTIKNFLKYGKGVDGAKQPNLDNFSTQITNDLLVNQKAELVFLHLTDTDTHKHHHGIYSKETLESLKRMGDRLKLLVNSAKDNYQIIILSDHAQVDVKETIDLNSLKLIDDIWWHQSAGSAYLMSKRSLNNDELEDLKNKIRKEKWFNRFLSDEEMQVSGFSKESILGICPAKGYALFNQEYKHIGNHGLPLDTPNYQPFYFVSSPLIKTNQILKGGTLLDICPLMLKLLNLPDFPYDGELRKDLFK